jgi:hypothetical protein
MTPGLQEALALIIVLAIVGFALYRRWRRSSRKASCCEGDDGEKAEHTVRFYRRDSR